MADKGLKEDKSLLLLPLSEDGSQYFKDALFGDGYLRRRFRPPGFRAPFGGFLGRLCAR
jgi:hypothetical protein